MIPLTITVGVRSMRYHMRSDGMFQLTMTVDMRLGKVCAAMAVEAVDAAAAPTASVHRMTRHMTTNIVPPGHHSSNLNQYINI